MSQNDFTDARSSALIAESDDHMGGPRTGEEYPKSDPLAHEARADRDPEDLVLRAAPRRTVRFRKGLLIGAAAVALTVIASVSWFALEPAGLQLASSEETVGPALIDTSPEELARLPQGYGDGAPVPELGPPLPGDLGRPILAHQREMANEEASPSPAAPPDDTRAQNAQAERQRRAAEVAQARSAPVLMQVSGDPTRAAHSVATPVSGADTPAPLSDSGRNHNRLMPPASRWQISAGSVIAASLITGLNSDLPGMVVAQVTEPVFDSASGRAVLIPQGARLLGRYDSKVAFGQRRAMLVWDRLVMPDGASLALDNAPATDAAGFAGLSDRVDFHSWQLLRGIGLSTVLGIGTELTFGDGEADLVRAFRESIQSNADRAGQKIVERNLDIAPTITVRPGYPVRVLVHKDLVLPPWRG